MVHFEPRRDLDSELEGAINEWEMSGDRSRLDAAKDIELIDAASQLASWLIKSSQEMVPANELRAFYERGNRPSEVLEELGLRAVVLEEVQLLVAYEYCLNTAEMAKRALHLGDLVIAASPRESVLRFLRRLGRCYIAGFDAECVVLCRAAMEAALMERYDREGVPVPADNRGKTDLEAKIRGAGLFKWLSPQLEKQADLVRRRGNTAVHKDPDAVKDVPGTITAMAEILTALYA